MKIQIAAMMVTAAGFLAPAEAPAKPTHRGQMGQTATTHRGPRGFRGPRGPQGPPGVSGYGIYDGPQTALCASPPGDPVAACSVGVSDARCPAGQRVLGGGFSVSIAHVAASGPDGDGGGWFVVAGDDTSIPVNIQATAICGYVT